MSVARRAARRVRAGFTLVEMIVAMGLFALIGVAGFTLLGGVTGVQERTDGRLQALGDRQRGLYLISRDLEAAEPDSVTGGAEGLAFIKRTAQGRVEVAYAATGGDLARRVGPPGLAPPQQLMAGVESLTVRSWRRDEGWRDGVGDDPPQAVAIELSLSRTGADGGGALRRVVALADTP